MPVRLGGSRRAAIIPLAALIGAFPARAQPAKTAPDRPNIVILLADDWGFSAVGSFGAEFAPPNIDALASAGMRFSNFTVAGSSSPSRAMLQTGVMTPRNALGQLPETLPAQNPTKP